MWFGRQGVTFATSLGWAVPVVHFVRGGILWSVVEEGSDHGDRGSNDDEGVFDAARVLVRYRRETAIGEGRRT
jgi:hypothetical protein